MRSLLNDGTDDVTYEQMLNLKGFRRKKDPKANETLSKLGLQIDPLCLVMQLFQSQRDAERSKTFLIGVQPISEQCFEVQPAKPTHKYRLVLM